MSIATTPFLSAMDPRSGLIDAGAARGLGSDLAGAYAAGQPFPHIVIDDFLPPTLAQSCFDAMEQGDLPKSEAYDRAQERFKSRYDPEEMPADLRRLFYVFNSAPFVRIVQNITGISRLIPDPYFLGGGFHETATGGHLSVHADFNHHRLMDVERRVNLLIYLNPGWKEEFGGTLELWDDGMAHKVRSVVPEFNRCVIFNTTSQSYHGNPQPIAHPGGLTRKSIALYYYTATWDGERKSHSTRYRSRPGSDDTFDWKLRSRELLQDLCPPIAMRAIRRLRSGPGASKTTD